jgi:hypothetical protein
MEVGGVDWPSHATLRYRFETNARAAARRGECSLSRIAIARLAVGGARTPLLSFVRSGYSDPPAA